MKVYSYKILILLSILICFFAFPIQAFSSGEERNFYVDYTYDLYGRKEINAELIRISDLLYFYVEKDWWHSRSYLEKNDIKIAFYELSEEFKNKIYPSLTSFFGSEWKPGIDNDEKITILFHQMGSNRAGYFRPVDEYSRFENPFSNEKEMLYLNSKFITDDLMEGFLAHEFVHLITFNQKDKKYLESEETWLNELRAEYAVTYLGYNNVYKNSNLEKRVNNFLADSNISLTGWTNNNANYGAINLFAQYLVDYYGNEILVDSLHSEEIGIESINYALEKRGFQESFSDIFVNWLIALYLNDCDLGEKYCFKNKNLEDFKVFPYIDYLPTSSSIKKLINLYIKDWSGGWLKIIGGSGDIAIEFDEDKYDNYKIPYILCDLDENCSVNFIEINNSNKLNNIEINNFEEYNITIIAFMQDKLSGFNGEEETFSFPIKISMNYNDDSEKDNIYDNTDNNYNFLSCESFINNLYFGLWGNKEVKCLQEFLKNQGADIYPEGLVTGNFLSLTKAAVIRFQEKYPEEILAPWGINKGTGFVGKTTRAKINEIIK